MAEGNMDISVPGGATVKMEESTGHLSTPQQSPVRHHGMGGGSAVSTPHHSPHMPGGHPHQLQQQVPSASAHSSMMPPPQRSPAGQLQQPSPVMHHHQPPHASPSGGSMQPSPVMQHNHQPPQPPAMAPHHAVPQQHSHPPVPVPQHAPPPPSQGHHHPGPGPSHGGGVGPGPPNPQLAHQPQPQQPLVSKPVIPQDNLQRIIQILRHHGYRETEEALVRESKYRQASGGSDAGQRPSGPPGHENTLAEYQNQQAKVAADYFADYQSLLDFIDARALDSHKAELISLIYPTFIHMYLEMVANRQRSDAQRFFGEFAKCQEPYWLDDLKILVNIREPNQLTSNDWFQHLKENTFVIRLAREPFDAFLPFLQTKQLLQDLLKRHVHIEIFDGPPRDKEVADSSRGSFSGEALVKMNRYKIFHGLIRDSLLPSVGFDIEEETSVTKNKKKAKSKDLGTQSKKPKIDPNAPPQTKQIPLPKMSETLKMERQCAAREIAKRLKISAEKLPSVCFYTVTNAGLGGACCADTTEDSKLIALGMEDSTVKVYTLNDDMLKPYKPLSELEAIDRDTDDLIDQMIDDSVASNTITFTGHSGPVYGVSFSPENNLVLSASEDGTVRMWNMQLWANLIAYRAGTLPVWDVKFGPYGHYFVTGSADKSAAMWSVDRPSPLRLFSGHFSDINVVDFHPNGHYVATGSADRSVRIWDVLAGQNVRAFSGSKGGVQSVSFSPCGQLLLAGDESGHLLVWDIAQGRLMANLPLHTDAIGCLAFSREGTIVATGSTDCSIGLHSLQVILTELEASANLTAGGDQVAQQQVAQQHNNQIRTSPAGVTLASWKTKATPVINVHFTRKNLLLGTGCFED